MFVGAAPGVPREEVLEGVRVVRRGGAVLTRVHAALFARRRSAGFDVIVEEINTLPYWARLWSRVPVMLCIHQIAGEVWDWEAPRGVGRIGRASEPFLLSCARSSAIVLSDSTKHDLMRFGYAPAQILVIAPGLSIAPRAAAAEQERNYKRVAYVGRLAPSKRVDHAIKAIAELARSGTEMHLDIVGRGPVAVKESLKREASRLGITGQVVFHDFLEAEARDVVLGRAAAVVMTSVREGWGMSVTEAGALGTPSVVYRCPGLVDSTIDGVTGIVVDPTPRALAQGIGLLTGDHALWSRLSEGARIRTRELTWERTSTEFEAALQSRVDAV